MWNEPSKERLAKIPKLYATESVPLQDKLIYLHFFIANSHWYIAEYDGDDLFWGFVLLGDDYMNAEWGYVSFKELKEIKVDGWFEIDCELEELWKVRKASEIGKIRKAHGWLRSKKKDELIMKVKAGHFQHFRDLFAEVTKQHSNFLALTPIQSGR